MLMMGATGAHGRDTLKAAGDFGVTKIKSKICANTSINSIHHLNTSIPPALSKTLLIENGIQGSISAIAQGGKQHSGVALRYKGPEDSPFVDGEYHGKIVFPAEYPFKPPSIQMITPNGRFEPNTRLCLSMSDFHPETWCPGWSVASVLTGLLSFMLETTPTTGSVNSTDEEKKALAAASWGFNRANPKFLAVFPELAIPPS
ncbi:ubiquitin-conjugating enzyme/RWD-like protein [Chytridium lagenaria]|nr:ubiquitin-conjugating enzyme/RWD-like protein [Chytridium lagenaria]